MADIRLDLSSEVVDGQTLIFRSPVDCSEITGLKLYYPEGGERTYEVFEFADAHGNNVGSTDLFATDVLVKVILDTKNHRAYVQNADTNAYLENRINIKQNRLAWVTEADLDAMIAGTYEGVEDEAPVEIVGSTITMQDGKSGLYYSLYVENGELKMEVG